MDTFKDKQRLEELNQNTATVEGMDTTAQARLRANSENRLQRTYDPN